MATEEVVKAFNKELATMKNAKSALSKDKIIAITKAAMSALRYYKHVVYAVEKFLAKCNTKLKVPGVYVIDSIVRQGQKQFKHKDVFGPRFAVNILQTIEGILGECPVEDRLKVVRVINLWKNHEVFSPEVSDSLLELCRRLNLETDVEKVEHRVKGAKADMSIYRNVQKKRGTPRTPPPIAEEHSNGNGEVLSLSESQFNDLFTRMYPTLADGLNRDKESLKKSYKIFQGKLKDSVEREKAATGGNIAQLLTTTFDYSDDEDETADRSKPEPISKERLEALARNICEQSEFVSEVQSTLNKPLESRRRESYNRDDRSFDRGQNRSQESNLNTSIQSFDSRASRNGRRKRSVSPPRSDRDPRKKRHRERSPEKKSKRRSRSRTPESAADKDREKERKRNGLPTHPKRDCLVLATRTLWFGRLPTNCVDHQIKEALKISGYEPEKVNIIPSRACAYVTMPSRRAAFKIMDKYKRDIKIADRSIKVDWATGVGLQKNDRLMDYWDADKGYAQIPHQRLPSDIGQLIQGNYVDVDTLPSNLKGKYHSTGPVESDPIPPPADPDQAMIASIPTPAAANQPLPPPFPPLPPNPAAQGIQPTLTQQLPAGFPNLGLAPHLLQPNILAAVLAQQQNLNLDQLMSQFQSNNLVQNAGGNPPPSQIEQPDSRGPPPPRPHFQGRGGPRFNNFNSPRPDGQTFFRGRGRGQFRGQRMPFRGSPRFDHPRPRFEAPEFQGNANLMPLGVGPMNIPPPDLSALLAAGLPPPQLGSQPGLPMGLTQPMEDQSEPMQMQDDEMDHSSGPPSIPESFKLPGQRFGNLPPGLPGGQAHPEVPISRENQNFHEELNSSHGINESGESSIQLDQPRETENQAGNAQPRTPEGNGGTFEPRRTRFSAPHEFDGEDPFRHKGPPHDDSYEDNPFQNNDDDDNQPKSPEEKFTNNVSGDSPMHMTTPPPASTPPPETE
ncbi:unnamed protein product [Bursaphelenchus xylophilus]|uniref:(pine wood nematode) hypothetical protein n=1 Tax=Bursaphelenchus xylophilus TaxID=6326 RepID=A0A1I7SC35_BURXY|nr:unnamed protein product [Bursaphelenchus xylophilus]CAG9086473.1 unnamed protein product [Bursaphelenchus xylophilus]